MTEHDFDAQTYTAAPTAEFSSHEYRRRHERFRETGYRHRGPSTASEVIYGLGEKEAFRNSVEYERYLEEMEQIVGERVTETRVPKPPAQPHYNGSSDDGNNGRSGYEVVNHHIVEDGPERTVEISTWREMNNNSSSGGGVKSKRGGTDKDRAMSVYYMSAQDVATGSKIAEAEEQRKRKLQRTPSKSEASWQSWDPIHSPPHRIQSQSEYSTMTPRPLSPPTIPDGPSTIHGHLPSPPRSPNSNSTTGSLLSPLLRGFETSSPQPLRALSQTSSPTPPIPSIHPLSLENILASTTPSLLHLHPTLQALGIHSPAHLKAIGRLSEETRDKEVRGEALRMGVTVVEWAILLDRVLTM